MEKYKTKEEYLQGCKSVLHIGGHTGQEGQTYARMGLSCVFVEPMPKQAEIARSKGYTVLQIAVSDFRGIASFNVAKVSERSSLLDAPKDVMEVEKKIIVPVLKLGDICNSFDALSIDTQGSTGAILNGANKEQLRSFKVIICEVSEKPRYKGEQSRREVAMLLERAGFREVASFKHKTLDIYDTIWKK